MDRYDVLLLIGWLMLTIGCGLVYFPLGLIVGGIGCMAIAIVGARAATPVAPAQKEILRGPKPAAQNPSKDRDSVTKAKS